MEKIRTAKKKTNKIVTKEDEREKILICYDSQWKKKKKITKKRNSSGVIAICNGTTYSFLFYSRMNLIYIIKNTLNIKEAKTT
jgi:hypothetical protein